MGTCNENSTHHQLHEYNVSPGVVQCNELGRIYLDGYFSILLVFPLCLQLSAAVNRKWLLQLLSPNGVRYVHRDPCQ